MNKNSLLAWYRDAGVDEAVGDVPVDRFQQAPPALHQQEAESEPAPAMAAPAAASPLQHSPSAANSAARQLADSCDTLEALEEAVRAFDGCALKKTASKTVFADGNPKARVMIIGEAPGAQEDIQGIPFCGPSGALLDRMFAAIGLNREESLYISNTVFWRPPGNRQPSTEETTICLPLVEKHIALINPALLILCGGTATTALLNKDISISRLRGRMYEYTNPYLEKPIPAAVTYHPSYLLRSPGQKRLVWNDLLFFKDFLQKSGVIS